MQNASTRKEEYKGGVKRIKGIAQTMPVDLQSLPTQKINKTLTDDSVSKQSGVLRLAFLWSLKPQR